MTYSLAKFGVCFGDVDTSYTVSDVTAAVGVISRYFNLIRTYDDFNSAEKYAALMDTTESNNIDVILGIPNKDILDFDAKTFIKNHAYKPDGTVRPNLKCIIVGNETYGGDKYKTYAPSLAACVTNLITEIKATDDIKDLIAVSIDFGPALHEGQNLSECDFTGSDGKKKSTYIVDAMKAILNGGLSTPKMVFGNLYAFYAPRTSVDLDTAALMINQYAGTSTGWYPYTASLEALKKYKLEDLILNCGETGWATDKGDDTTQVTSVDRLNMYLKAYQTYINTPSTYSNINEFKGMTSIFFEMFDEPLKKDFPWEPYWGMYNSIDSGTGVAPTIKTGVVIPFKAS